jgi:glycosyltransferase involved in cell wall biosynthesis
MPILFVNPHIHHSYFTILAISQVDTVAYLCPPLQLQLINDTWNTEKLKLVSSSPILHTLQLVSLIIFLFYKCRLCSERFYIQCLNLLSSLLVQSYPNSTFVHYQDYISLSKQSRSLVKLDVCELIICSNRDQSNYLSTIRATELASVLVFPTLNNLSDITTNPSKSIFAPYGGDKIIFKKTSTFSFQTPARPYKNAKILRIAARSNSFRKGLDHFLEALSFLDNYLHIDKSITISIHITICGQITDPRLIHRYMQTKKSLKKNGLIMLKSKQYSELDYIKCLLSSDLFIMPSRLEGSSPAALEALWLGVPAVLTKECGIDQFRDKHHGILLEHLSSKEIMKSIISIVRDPSLISVWSTNLSRDRHHFSWSTYLKVYKQLLQDSN